MNSAKYILDSNGTAVYDGERIMVVMDNDLELNGTLFITKSKFYFRPENFNLKFNIKNYKSFYKLMERQVINE